MKHLPSTLLMLAILVCGGPWAKRPDLITASAGAAPLRRILSLDCTWQVAEGGFDVVPAEFEHQVPVPGLVDLAAPPFVEPGPQRGRLFDAFRHAYFWNVIVGPEIQLRR